MTFAFLRVTLLIMNGKFQSLNSSFFLEKAVVILLYAALFTPLAVTSVFYFPFIFSKTIFFRTIVELAFFFYILLIFAKPEYRPRLSKVAIAAAVYLGVVILSSVFGLDWYRSFWGDAERGEGIILLLHLAVFFVMLGGVFRTAKDWRGFFYAAIFIGFLESAYAITQSFIPTFGFRTGMGERFAGTVGNPSFLAAYLLFTLFLALGLLLDLFRAPAVLWKKISAGIFLGIAIVLNFFVIFNTQTRGALLAALGGFALLAVFTGLTSKNAKMKIVSAAFVFFLLASPAAVWFGKDWSLVKSNPTLNRIATISLEDITTASRFEVWKTSWKGWQDNFLLGAGYENFNLVFDAYFPPKVFRDQGSQLWFDRAHNIIFDVGVTSGIIGLLAYFAIFAMAGYALWRYWSSSPAVVASEMEQPRSFFSGPLFIIILAVYFFQNLFVFDTVSSHLMFVVILAMAHFAERTRTPAQAAPSPMSGASGKILHVSFFSVFTLAIVISFVVYFVNARSVLANYYAASAIRGQRLGWEYEEIANSFKKSLSYNEYQQADIRQRLAEMVLLLLKNQSLPQDQLAQATNFALEEIQKNMKAESLDVKYYLSLMSLYNSSDQFDPKRLEQVEEIGQIALKLSPTRPQTYFELGQAMMSMKKYDEGIAYFKKAVELNDRPFESHWNLAAAYLTAGMTELADEEFKKAQERGFTYDSANNLLKIAYIARISQNYDKMVETYLKLTELQPDNADFYAKLAAAYQLAGDNEKAQQAARKAGEIDASYKSEAQQFIQQLEVK